jgi:hypothetical protein
MFAVIINAVLYSEKKINKIFYSILFVGTQGPGDLN